MTSPTIPSPRLITIRLSHFCEKARWALDHARVKYVEDGHAPIAHMRFTKAVGGKSVPVYVDGENVLRDSTDIVLYANEIAADDRKLIPADEIARAEVLALEKEFDETLGIDARRVIYWHQLSNKTFALPFIGRMFRVENGIARRILKVIFRKIIFSRYRVNATTTAESETRMRDLFARMSEKLATHKYLVGDHFTLADLTFASLATPVIAPSEHPLIGANPIARPEALTDFREELLGTPAGQHVLRVYREHRKA